MASDSLFIDDSVINIAGADQPGFKTTRCESPERMGDELRSLPILWPAR